MLIPTSVIRTSTELGSTGLPKLFNLQTMKNQFSMLYHKWKYRAESDELAVIHPDGCRDLIVLPPSDQPSNIRLTNWDFQPRIVELKAGTEVTGYRLRPGVTIDARVIEMEKPDVKQLGDLIRSEGLWDPDNIEIIEALTQPGATVVSVARQQGVTTRTLQRRFRSLLLPTPDYWRLLGRARRTVKALPYRVPLAEIAYEYGYCDQAHMTREFVRWFGLTPSQLRQNKVRFDEISQLGLGNWSDDSSLELENLH